MKDDLISVMEKTRSLIGPDGLSKNLEETNTLCYCFLLSMEQIITGSLAALEAKSILAHQIIARSLTEYLVDLWYIVSYDSRAINRKLAKHHKVTLYLKSEIIDSYRGEIPRHRTNYFEYIIDVHPDIIGLGSATPSVELVNPDWKAIRKMLRQKGWSLLSFKERLWSVLLLNAISKDMKDPHKEWQKCDQKLRQDDPEAWEDYSFNERADRIIKTLQIENRVAKPMGLDSVDECFSLVLKSHSLHSEFTHPTPRSIGPHFNPTSDTFYLEYDYGENEFYNSREFLFLVFTSAVNAITPIFPNIGGENLRQKYKSFCSQAPQIRQHLWDYLIDEEDE